MVTFRFSPASTALISGLNPTPSLQDVIYFAGGEDVMFRMLASLAFVMLWTVFAHAQQPANSRLDDIIKRGTLRVGMTGDYLPFTYLDKTGTRVIVNPGGTNERFAKANIRNAEIKTWNDNVTIFDEIAKGNADLMMTDSSETRYQQKQHPGVLCAVHPEKPFDFAEKAYWLQRDIALKAFVDQWLHITTEDGSFRKIYAAWFD